MKTFKNSWSLVLGATLTLATISCDEHMDMHSIPGKFLFEETFEGASPFSTVYGKEVGTWDYALQFVNSPTYQGSGAARFEIRADQPLIADGKRAEVTIFRGIDGFITKDTWYSFAAYFPSQYYEIDHTHEVICQWYKDGSPVRLITRDDKLILDIGNEKGAKEEYEIGTITKDTWHELVFHFIHSHMSDGFIEVWHNGELKIKRYGGNMYNSDLPKWKVGIYKASFLDGKADVSHRVIYFDNIRVGNPNCNYNLMKPGR